jgi:riboflavin biosynthesis pyrimidine reductase
VPSSATRWRIEALWSSRQSPGLATRGGELPAELGARFDAPLEITLRSDRPTVVANFVSTVDGVVALDRSGASGGRDISGGFGPDRFVMGLLRATADAVLVGAGTVRASSSHVWQPAHVFPASADGYAAWRRSLGLTAAPATVIVTASGDLDTDHVALANPSVPIVVVTTAAGARRLGRRVDIEVVAVGERDRVPVHALLELLDRRAIRVVLSEAGPTVFSELVAAGAVDDLFLTVSPQLVGRSDATPRLGLVEGVGFAPGLAPWAALRSVMRARDHLFLRYDLSKPEGAS